jgi:hypothetical protein
MRYSNGPNATSVGPWPVNEAARLKFDPATLDWWQREALERATCASAVPANLGESPAAICSP